MRPEALARIERRLRTEAHRDGINDFVVGVAVFRQRRLLVVRRVPDDYNGGLYELPGGGVESGETFADCAARELLEETGLRLRGITEFLGGIDYATRTKARVRKFSFVAEVEPGEVELAPGEHDDYAWIDANELEDLPMAPDMRASVRSLVHAI
ncbi:NUDIX domain-containing protein [Nocardia puris]|uniref:8-oxo-dGTP diphosphatase n=1 Tax=Nocardia puris TaxID=208602 RepID=A0A366DQ88_9NOCA|nr:NUDIX domain-containing protein [Nocardia puris]MBF6213656.1 NUDIX domain-containing protein [Nocardia puris]MBF6365414.1 NUDIX domain-containing protein [Nocardia puris]MBF6459880.1 NUDIX domain-containing protein [Nocardia puris]RBO91639.1 8-oxo-dGTP diphosphatase [Nocardia puris]